MPPRIEISGTFVTDYAIREVPSARQLILVLHGFQHSGETTLSRLLPALPDDARVLAPNGPYPIPEKRAEGYRMGFSWYFYNPKTDEYFIDMKVAVTFLNSLLVQLNPEKLPMTVIGFSQGGYLAPFFAASNPQVNHVVGIACRFLPEELDLSTNPHCRMDSILGDQDEYLREEDTRASFRALKENGVPGELHVLKGVPHKITPEVLQTLKQILKTRL